MSIIQKELSPGKLVSSFHQRGELTNTILTEQTA